MKTFSCLVGGSTNFETSLFKKFLFLTHLKNPKKTKSYRGKKQTKKPTFMASFQI